MIWIYHDLLAQILKVIPVLIQYLHYDEYLLIIDLIVLLYRIEFMTMEYDGMEYSVHRVSLGDDYSKDIIRYIYFDNDGESWIEMI
jgi:hypothetical protein